MGHFTHNCKLTGIPIKDNATLIVMKQRADLYDNSHESLMKYGKSCMVSNEGTRLKFLPVWFPIHGRYDDYGGLEDIIEDDNTRALESYYGMSIQDLVNVVTSGRKDDGYDGNLDVVKNAKDYPSDWIKGEKHFTYYQRKTDDFAPNGGGYARTIQRDNETVYMVYRDSKFVETSKEIYEKDVKDTHDHYKRYQEWTKSNPDPEDDYNKPQYQQKYKDLISYSAMWVHGDVYQRLTESQICDDYDKLDLGTPEVLEHLGFKEIGKSDDKNERYNRIFEKDGLKVNSDGTWINVHDEGIYTLKQFKKYCDKKGVDIDISKLEGVGRIGQTYELLLKNYKPKETYFKRDADRYIEYYFLGGPFSNYGSINPMTEHYINEAKNGKLKDELIRFWDFNAYLYTMGGYYEIVGTGPQDGEFKEVKKILEIALEVINEKIKDYYEEEDLDDEEDEEEND